MTASNILLFCFVLGAVWTIASWLLGAGHLGHSHAGGHHAGTAHGHAPHAPHSSHAGHAKPAGSASSGSLLLYFVSPPSLGVFLTWFGGMGYLLTRHTGLEFWLDLTIAGGLGVIGALAVASFLRFLQSKEKPLDPADFYLPGTLARVSSTIRPDGIGEVLYVQHGVRRSAAARSENGTPIPRGADVVVTRFEKSVVFVQTWDAMLTQRANESFVPESLLKETKDVE